MKNLPKEPSFDLLGGFESEPMAPPPDVIGTCTGVNDNRKERVLTHLVLAGNAPRNAPGLDDIFNLGAPQPSAIDDLNLNFNAFSQPEPSGNGMSYAKNNMNFDPFGNGFSDGGNVPLKPMNTSQQPSKETSPQQSQPPQPVRIANKGPSSLAILTKCLRFNFSRQIEIRSPILPILLPV